MTQGACEISERVCAVVLRVGNPKSKVRKNMFDTKMTLYNTTR